MTLITRIITKVFVCKFVFLNKPVTILAIESSCDETSAAVLREGKILSNVTASQEVHEQYGGVVPELASRVHQQNIIPVVDAALKQAVINKEELSAIAVTEGPGLIGSLMVGVSFAKSLSLALHIPLLAVHHMQAHVAAHYIETHEPKFPFLCLTVSGGHTQIVLVKNYLDMHVVGETLDDAAGEAFDKAAKILGLPYPGGPLIDKHAQEGKAIYKFPEPNIPGLNFSFSGLKTSFLNFIREKEIQDSSAEADKIQDLKSVCASIQERIVSILIHKLEKAAKKYSIKEIAIAGGVSANSGLRSGLRDTGKKHGWNTYVPRLEYCTDNAAMIAITGYYKFLRKDFAGQNLVPLARMPLLLTPR